MIDNEIETEGFDRRFVSRRGYEFLCRSNDQMAEMDKRVGRRRAYELAGLESVGDAFGQVRAG